MRRKRPDYLDMYLKVADVLHYASGKEFNLMIFGSEERRGITEEYLPHLFRRRKLKRVNYRGSFVYMPRRVRYRNETYPKLPHYLSCAKCLARIYRSLPGGQIVYEREFAGHGVIPEWGIEYPGGTLLLFEYCTASNYRYSGLMRAKIDAYQKHLPELEAKFKAKAMVLFVLDIDRPTVAQYVADKNITGLPVYFTDYKTFMDQPIGTHLQAPIYIYANSEVTSLV